MNCIMNVSGEIYGCLIFYYLYDVCIVSDIFIVDIGLSQIILDHIYTPFVCHEIVVTALLVDSGSRDNRPINLIKMSR